MYLTPPSRQAHQSQEAAPTFRPIRDPTRAKVGQTARTMPQTVPFPTTMTDLRNPLVVLRQLTHSYREGHLLRPVLLGIDGAIGRGEFVALFGQSGSGKSTLLNLIAGLDLARSGTVMIEGHDLAGLDEHRRTLFRRRHIGFVYQFFHLIPTLTVEENVALPAELNGYSAALTRERCRTLLDEVGLAHRAASFPDTLSGGTTAGRPGPGSSARPGPDPRRRTDRQPGSQHRRPGAGFAGPRGAEAGQDLAGRHP